MKTHNRSSASLAHAGADAAPCLDMLAQQAAENEGWPVAAIAPPALFYATPWRWYFHTAPVDSVQDARAVRLRSPLPPSST